jgi:hypothetical protein
LRVKHDPADRLSIRVENLKVVFELAAAEIGGLQGEGGHEDTRSGDGRASERVLATTKPSAPSFLYARPRQSISNIGPAGILPGHQPPGGALHLEIGRIKGRALNNLMRLTARPASPSQMVSIRKAGLHPAGRNPNRESHLCPTAYLAQLPSAASPRVQATGCQTVRTTVPGKAWLF